MEIRTLDAADIERVLHIRDRSFGILGADGRAGYEASIRKAIDAETTVGAYDGSLLVGRAFVWPFRQWWGGRDLSMAGVAGVVVAPEYRGRGVGAMLMNAMVRRSHDLGFALSALYPATVPVYRQCGYEMAGAQYRLSIEADRLRELRESSVAVREATAADAADIVAMIRERYASGRDHGPKDDSLDELREELAEPGIFAYVADAGFLEYAWNGSDLEVYRLVAADVETARALWAVVGSGSSIAKTVHVYASPDDPVVHLLGDGVVRDMQVSRWMLRCIDVRAAISGRGFRSGLQIDVAVVLDDVQVPENRIVGRLEVADGAGSVVEGALEPDAARLGANGLAALYAGTPTATLRTAGLLSGGSPAVDEQLDAAFAGRPAYLLDFF
jgi:predicted acetyltransferase